MQRYIAILFFLISVNSITAAQFDLGISAVNNFETKEIGAGLRIVFNPSPIFRIIPQATYYPSAYKLHEYTLGLGIELDLIRGKKHGTYLVVNAAYNQYVSAKESLNEKDYINYWFLEGGLGFTRKKGRLRPFAELRFRGGSRTNSNLRIGLVYLLSNPKKSSLRRKRCKTLSSSWN